MKQQTGPQNLLQSATAAELVKNREAIAQLAKSSDAHRLMDLLKQGGGVQKAAAAAAAGDASQLMEMMNRLMNTEEGAQLVQRIGKQAKDSGL